MYQIPTRDYQYFGANIGLHKDAHGLTNEMIDLITNVIINAPQRT
jgi:hypothetical protein